MHLRRSHRWSRGRRGTACGSSDGHGPVPVPVSDLTHAAGGPGAAGSRPRAAPRGRSPASSTPKRSIAPSATSAPASSCRARPSETPGSSARSAAVMPASRGTHSSSDSRLSSRCTYRPSAERAAPAIRASCLKVLEVPTTWSGGAEAAELADRPGDLGPHMAAQRPARPRRRAGRPAASPR